MGSVVVEGAEEEAVGEERNRLYRAQAERAPQFDEYEQKTDRIIPAIVLTPVASD